MNNNYDNGAFDRLDMAISDTRGIIDSLNYAGYRHNRRLSPHIEPMRYSAIFADWEALEDRYQAELLNGGQ